MYLQNHSYPFYTPFDLTIPHFNNGVNSYMPKRTNNMCVGCKGYNLYAFYNDKNKYWCKTCKTIMFLVNYSIFDPSKTTQS